MHYKAILKLGIPIAIGQLGTILMGFADTMMVGHYSTEALAASSFVTNFFNLPIFMLMGYSYGLTPLISALAGKDCRREAGATLRRAMVCNLGFALLIMAVMGAVYFFLGRLGQPAELLPLIRPYYLTILASLFFVAVYNVLRQFTDGISETAVGMWALLVGNVLNLAGNFLLIYGVGPFPEMGLLGAGVSTLFSRAVSALLMVAVLLLRPRYAVYRSGFAEAVCRFAHLRQINAQSLPVSLQMGMETGAFTCSAVMVGWLGALELAAFQVMTTLGTLGFLFYYSFGAGLSIRVASFYGQRDWGNLRAATRAGVRILFVLACLSSLVFCVAGGFIVRLFTSDTAVIALAVSLIPALVLYQMGDAMQVCFANALRGTSHVVSMMRVAFVSYLVINVPAGYILSFPLGLGAAGLFIAFSLGLFTAAALFYHEYRKVLRSAAV